MKTAFIGAIKAVMVLLPFGNAPLGWDLVKIAV